MKLTSKCLNKPDVPHWTPLGIPSSYAVWQGSGSEMRIYRNYFREQGLQYIPGMELGL